jgi:two-component system, cell cycle sensor histidine kinase and response regulator CckA
MDTSNVAHQNMMDENTIVADTYISKENLQKASHHIPVDFRFSQDSQIYDEQLYRNIVEYATAAIFVIEDNCFIYVNPKFEEIYGYSHHEICDEKMSLFNIITPDYHEFLQLRLQTPWPAGAVRSHYELKAITRDQRIIDIELDTVRITDLNRSRVIGISKDVTNKKRMETQVIQAQKMEAIGQLAAGIAHDFNNLLTGIMVNLDLLSFDIPDENSLSELIIDAKKSARRAAELTNQLLTFSRQNQGMKQVLNINDIVNDVTKFLMQTIDRRIEIVTDLTKNIAEIKADHAGLNQVILNLCINSRDAINECFSKGDQKLHRNQYQIQIITQNIVLDSTQSYLHPNAKPGSYVLLTIVDNGIGMNEKIINRIFEPFFSTKDFDKGTGLGLAAVYGIIEQHQGWIDVSSEVNVGTTMKVYMPAYQEQMIKAVISEKPAEVVGDETILLVDDEPIIRNLGKRLLERKGYKVLIAGDGKEALEMYQQNIDSIDLIILDLTMPHLSGIDVLKMIRQISDKVKVILTSGFAHDESEHNLETIGAADFVSKPYDYNIFLAKIRKVLDS